MNRWTTGIGLVALVVALGGGEVVRSKTTLSKDDPLVGAIRDGIAKARDGEASLDIADLVAGDWIRMVIVPPYASPAKIAAIPDVDAAEVEQTRISLRDDIVLLIFVAADGADTLIPFPRSYGDFRVKGIVSLERAAATFAVRGNEKRPGWLDVIPSTP